MDNVDFDVVIANRDADGNLDIPAVISDKWLHSAVSIYDKEMGIMASVLDYSTTVSDITQEQLVQIATGTQSDINKILQANALIQRFCNLNDAVGLVVSAVRAGINTDIRLSYDSKIFDGKKQKMNKLEKAKSIVDDFLRQINVRDLIRDAVLTTYLAGNYIGVLRSDGNGKYSITSYPLGIAEISPYLENNEPIIQINMSNLRSALQRTILRNKKGKALYYDNVLKEIEGAFGKEIQEAYKNKDAYCRMPVQYTGVVRVNTLGGIYGLSPIFRCLSSALALENLRNADLAIAAAKRKVLLHQKMRKELCLHDQDSNFQLLAWNHNNLLKAMKMTSALITTDCSVESIEYVTPKADEVPIEKQQAYQKQVLSSLGVAFLVPDSAQSATAVKISFEVLIRMINSISESVERLIEQWIETVLDEHGFEKSYCPSVRIMDSELLDNEQKLELAKVLYGTFGASLETSLGVLGFDITDEKNKRDVENMSGVYDIFTPHKTAYTVSGDDDDNVGRPAGNDDNGRQDYDETYNKSRT